MAFAVDEAIMGWVLELVLEAVRARVEYTSASYFEQRRINSRVGDAVALVVEPLLPFLQHEGLREEQQRLLMQTCVEEMRALVAEPAKLFQASLDGQKVFDHLYAGKRYPEVIRDEGLEGTYEMVGPRIGALLCELPLVVEAWKLEKYREDYRRLDEIARELRAVFEKVDAQDKAAVREADVLLRRMRRTLGQRVRMMLDLTGLRGDRPMSGKLDGMFVHPRLSYAALREGLEIDLIEDEEEAASRFFGSDRRAVLTGPPGAGKSTWTKWLQTRALGDHWSGIAVRIELRRFASQEPPSYLQILRDEAGVHLGEELDAERIRRWVDGGKIVFLLDGFDELPLGRRDVVFQWITDLAETMGDCSVILTSRPLTTNHLEQLQVGWQSWSVDEFDEPRIVRYIEAWYRHAPLLADADRSIDAPGLAREWKQDSTLAPLTGNPLLLSTLLIVHHLDGRLPHGRAKLYQRYVDGMLGGWDDRRQVSAAAVLLSVEQKRRLLRRIALHMHFAGKDQLEEEATIAVIDAALRELRIAADANVVLDMLRERSGLLIGPGTYGFAHKSIGEFLVAEAIVEGNEQDAAGCRVDRMMLYGHRHEDRWTTVLFFWAGLASAGEVEALVRMCMKVDDWSDVLLAVSVVYDQGERLPVDMVRELLDRMVELSRVASIERFVSGADTWGWQVLTRDWDTGVSRIPLRALRGLYLDDILRDWRQSEQLQWLRFREAEGHIRATAGLTCLLNPSGVDEWRSCLRDAPPIPHNQWDSSAEARWLAPMHAALYRLAMFECGPLPSELVAVFREEVPSLERHVPVVAVLVFLAIHADLTDPSVPHSLKSRAIPGCHRALVFLTEMLTTDVDDDCLIETATVQSRGRRKGPADLLQGCLDALAAPLPDGTHFPSPAVETVSATLRQLIARRATLLAERGLPAASPTEVPQ